MIEWADESMINHEAIDNLTEAQVAEVLHILRDF